MIKGHNERYKWFGIAYFLFESHDCNKLVVFATFFLLGSLLHSCFHRILHVFFFSPITEHETILTRNKQKLSIDSMYRKIVQQIEREETAANKSEWWTRRRLYFMQSTWEMSFCEEKFFALFKILTSTKVFKTRQQL